MEFFFFKFLKFCVVGGSGTIVDFGITYVFKELFKTNKYVANAIGFTCAATSNFILNRIWTFQSNNPQVALQYMKFFVISVMGLALNTLIIWLLNGKNHVRFHKLVWKFCPRIEESKADFYSSKLIATAFVMLWNFTMNYFFTF